MRVDIVTIFPETVPGTLAVGVVGRALADGVLEVHAVDLRDHATGRHRQVDDAQFGGAAGMVLKPEPLTAAVRALRSASPAARCILMGPQGRRLTQEVARELAAETHLVLVCGRYQGVDERAREEIGEELSIGDFVLSGGEVAALAVVEAVARLLPGVVGSPESLEGETFSEAGDEPPLYTRPADFEGHLVPEVLRSGDHASILRWRRDQSASVRRGRDASQGHTPPTVSTRRAEPVAMSRSTGER